MGREDWYSRTTWTANDQEAFWARLRRSRGPDYRAGYLRIQAYYLEGAGIIEPAVTLLEHALREDPDGFDVCQIEHQLATCREKQRRLPEAIQHVRNALAAEARRPNHLTPAWLTLGRIAVEHEMHEVYAEALATINAHMEQRRHDIDMVPVIKYLHAAILAVITDHLGDKGKARVFAETALAAAGATRSGLRKHPKIGLVTDRDTRLHEVVVALAQGSA